VGKNKIDTLKTIEEKSLRNIAFCKRKRGFLLKAIEMSRMCDLNILICIYDKERSRMIEFNSDHNFNLQAA
jgi:hypothetical protein